MRVSLKELGKNKKQTITLEMCTSKDSLEK